ncbi:MAG: hypothetical protein ACE5EC_10925, partial [Phycisphaerae bacterium]
ALGGTFQGAGTDCATTTCTVLPTGACCLPDGSCAIESKVSCGNQNGEYKGDGKPCSAVQCEQPKAACCFADGACEDMLEIDCNNKGGTYQGYGVLCGSNPCPPPGGNADAATIPDQDGPVTPGVVTNPILVEVIGNGAVVLNPQGPAYRIDEVVVMTAIPDPGWRFDHWDRSLSGTQNPYALSVDDSTMHVTAVFTAAGSPQGSGVCGAGLPLAAGLMSALSLVGMRRRRQRRRQLRSR